MTRLATQPARARSPAEARGRLVSEILDSLACALPVPALLVDARGRVLWMSHEAETRLRTVALDLGSRPVLGGASSALADLAARVRQELDSPGAWGSSTPPDWLAAGETLIVRRVDRRDSRPLVLVSVAARAPEREASEPGGEALQQALSLSARETEVALLAAQGFSVINIAARLDVAESTVRTHLKRLYRKLGVCSRAELARAVYSSRE